jgi:hypothetical protein
MMERALWRDERERDAAIEACELTAFFRELGLGWEFDAEGLVERLAEARTPR